MSKTKILLVEDDPNLGSILKDFLIAKQFDVQLEVDGNDGYTAFTKGVFDLLIFDVMMPLKDGFTLAKEVRQVDAKIPIIFLTAKSMKEDTLEGFKVGADDYVKKPFSMEELLARVNAVLRRAGEQVKEKPQYEIGTLVFDFPRQTLTAADGESQKLTSKESQLLKLLCLKMNDVLDRSFALKSIWDDDSYYNSRSMDVYVTKLRKYLRPDENVEIVNVHGKGFKLLVHSN